MKSYAIYTRLGVGVTLIIFWGLVDSPLSGVAFLLALAALSAVRYRLAPYWCLPFLEAAVCIGYAVLWPPALLGLWLSVIGLLESRWRALERELYGKGDKDRAERLKLEALTEERLKDSQNAARVAELTERARIAQDIHDHVGHELSGAQIALQTAMKLYEKGDARAGDLLNQSARRLENASAHLRETVHNLKPAQTVGADTLAELCDAFDFCPCGFTATGDMNNIAHWALLLANLKETLTNAARHSGATQVAVKLDGNKSFVRMTVTDNGRSAGAFAPGLGISGMRERVRAAGGSLTVNTSDGFQVICVLPKEGMGS